MQICELRKEENSFNKEIVICFATRLKRDLPDTRDSRGKRHDIPFVILSFVLATLSGRFRLSSVHRFIENRLVWLREITNTPDAKLISRAHLPRLLAGLNWALLNGLIARYLEPKIGHAQIAAWFALDGKALRGSQYGEDRQSIVFAVNHQTRVTVACAPQIGTKSGEIPVVRNLLKETELDAQKVTLDAHHCNPETTAQINQAGGIYLVQVKENQRALQQQCILMQQTSVAIAQLETHDKAHGRITSRRIQLFALPEKIAPRWAKSALKTVVVVTRETLSIVKQKTTYETSYYVSNQELNANDKEATADLAQAVQKHWGVESNNWIRDSSFLEDKIKVKHGTQGQIMACLRGMAIELLRRAGVSNFVAAMERLNDIPEKLKSTLQQIHFL